MSPNGWDGPRTVFHLHFLKHAVPEHPLLLMLDDHYTLELDKQLQQKNVFAPTPLLIVIHWIQAILVLCI